MADGVDDDTWLFHLKNGDMSRWFADDGVKDKDMAGESVGTPEQVEALITKLNG